MDKVNSKSIYKFIKESAIKSCNTIGKLTRTGSIHIARNLSNRINQLKNKFKNKTFSEKENIDDKTDTAYLDTAVKIDLYIADSKPKIIFVGAIKVKSFDPTGAHRPLDGEYWAERVILKINDSEVCVYGPKLVPYISMWKDQLGQEDSEESFQEFMAKRAEVDDKVGNLLTNSSVRLFDDKEREQTLAHFDEGQVTQVGLDSENENAKEFKEGEYAFVLADQIDHENVEIVTRLYATPKIETEKGKIQHSSFMRGGNVISAGILTVDNNGNITKIRNQSGHYKPTDKELALIVDYLQKSGYNISKFYITCYKSQFYRKAQNTLHIDLKWGIVNQRADLWLEETGCSLIE